jgi:hypothetical protein
MAKKSEQPAAKSTPRMAGAARKSTPRRSKPSVWPLVGDVTLAIAAVSLAMAVALIGPARSSASRPIPLVAGDEGAAASSSAARIDAGNQLLVGEKPCPTISACLAELSAGGAGGRVQIVADGDAPFATLGALIEALTRDGRADLQVMINR